MTFINRDGRKIWREKVTRAKCVASVFPNAYRINVEKKLNYYRWSGTTGELSGFNFSSPRAKVLSLYPSSLHFILKNFLFLIYKSLFW